MRRYAEGHHRQQNISPRDDQFKRAVDRFEQTVE